MDRPSSSWTKSTFPNPGRSSRSTFSPRSIFGKPECRSEMRPAIRSSDLTASRSWEESVTPDKCSNGSPVAGRLGAKPTAISRPSRIAHAFHDELCYMLAHQMAAPNSPQWFNTGLHYAYGLSGPAQGHFYVDPKTREVVKATNAFEHPQPHACFIQSIDDDLVNENGIMDLWVREARLFKYGSGTGTNFSKLRGDAEPLSGGGRSSGLMSFLRIGDRAAGAIKSGGTTRRAAKMVCLDLDHPDIEEFIDWKVIEEQKVAAMVTGSKICAQRLNAVLKACHIVDGAGQMKVRSMPSRIRSSGKPWQRPAAIRCQTPTSSGCFPMRSKGSRILCFTSTTRIGTARPIRRCPVKTQTTACAFPMSFLPCLEADGDWQLKRRIDGKVSKTVKARDLWDRSLGPPGFARIPARNTTPPSTSGIPVRRTDVSMPRILARNTCFSTIRRAIWRR